MPDLIELNFNGLMQLDERKVSKLLMLHLNHIAQDIDNRPHELGKREVILKLTFQPKKSVMNEATDRVNCSIDCKTKTPLWRTNEYDMRITRTRSPSGQTRFGFQFNEQFADNADQNSLFETDTDGDHG